MAKFGLVAEREEEATEYRGLVEAAEPKRAAIVPKATQQERYHMCADASNTTLRGVLPNRVRQVRSPAALSAFPFLLAYRI